MNELLVTLLFWSSILFSLTLSVLGVLKEKSWLVIIGAILFFPISYYFNGSPSFHGYGLFLPLFQVISAAAVREKNKLWAWLFLAPSFLIVLWLIVVALFYQIS